MEIMENEFYEQYPALKKKGLPCMHLLSGIDGREHTMGLDFSGFSLAEEDVVLLRLHPFVSDHSLDEASYNGKIMDFSHYPGVTTLLRVADCLITDYSYLFLSMH